MARCTLPGDNVFPEGITEGGGTVFYVGSMGDGTIYRGDTATGAIEAFVPANGDGRVSVTEVRALGARHRSCRPGRGKLRPEIWAAWRTVHRG